MDDSFEKEFEKLQKKMDKAQQAYHLEWPYAHFIVTPQCIKQHKKELMRILQISPKDMKSLTSKRFFDILDTISDYPVIPRPFSNIANHIIKDEEEGNPYNVITQTPEFMKKLMGLVQYGVDIQPIGKDLTYIHNHTRYVHSLDTACNIELIMRNNGFSEDEVRKAIVAWCLHDVATPVFGDLTMKAFPQLKEEQWFSAYMAYYPEISKRIQEEFDVSLDELQSRIKNEGVIGKIIDIADRLAYTARDVSRVHHTMLWVDLHSNIQEENIADITKKDPYLFDIIMEISVEGDNVIFENPERLKNILLLRANMHNLIYLNPHLRTREEYFGLILQYLVGEWFMTLEQLQKWMYKDSLFINEFVLLEYIYKNNIIDHDPVVTYDFFDFHAHETKEAAIADMQKMRSQLDPNIPVHYLKTPPFKSGTNYLVRHEGNVQPLSDILSEQDSAQLQQLSQMTNRHLVLIPKEQYRNNHKTHAKLYAFLCRKADEAYQSLLKK